MSYEYARIPFKKGVNVVCGPNGSGKSTTMKMILGLLKADSGNLNVYGINVSD